MFILLFAYLFVLPFRWLAITIRSWLASQEIEPGCLRFDLLKDREKPNRQHLHHGREKDGAKLIENSRIVNGRGYVE